MSSAVLAIAGAFAATASPSPSNAADTTMESPAAAASAAAAAAVGASAPDAPPPADDANDLAKQLSNPVSSLISVPFQFNFDAGVGADDEGIKSTLNIQPVIPLSVSEDWNMIVRTIVPVTYQADVTASGAHEFGLGDIVQSVFFSPKTVGSNGVIWGVGPVFLYPSATDDRLGSERWGAGPTGVLLKQSGKTTFGILANHIWSFAGNDARDKISTTFAQPFISYTNANALTYSVNVETSYDWRGDNWVVPLNANIAQLTKIGSQPVQVGAGLRYYLEKPTGGPDWGFRLSLTLLFPKK